MKYEGLFGLLVVIILAGYIILTIALPIINAMLEGLLNALV